MPRTDEITHGFALKYNPVYLSCPQSSVSLVLNVTGRTKCGCRSFEFGNHNKHNFVENNQQNRKIT